MRFEVVRVSAVGAFLCINALLFADDPSIPQSPAWVSARVQSWQPKADEKRFDEIGWAPDIRAALQQAREQGRPVFLFTHDGRMNLGRC
ncbi:MAG: hypothetical protein AB1813_13830 [Verrucomicrobiota bacterium]|jgi:hypothetical protein